MVRRLSVLLICMVVLLTACKKRTEGPKAEPKGEGQTAVPEGMALVPDMKTPVFISKKPATVGEHVKFLRATGQPVPETVAGQSTEPREPVTGLTLEEAQQYATWQMMRLPEAEEWAKAHKTVGDVRYPWGAGLGTDQARKDAPVFLVRDWVEGSKREESAERRRQELSEKLLDQRTAEIQQMGNELLAAAEAAGGPSAEESDKAQRDVLAALQQKKECAEWAAREELLQKALRALSEMREQKKTLLRFKVADETPPAEEVDAAYREYEETVAKWRQMTQGEKEGLMEENAQLQERALALKQQLEAVGTGVPDELRAEAKALADECAVKADMLEEALQLKLRVQDCCDAVRKARKTAHKLLREAAGGLATQVKGLKKEVQAHQRQVNEQQELIQALQENIKDLGEHLDRQFQDEPFFFKDLAELAEAGVRKRALEAEIAHISEVLKVFARPVEEPQEAPAIPQQEALEGGVQQ